VDRQGLAIHIGIHVDEGLRERIHLQVPTARVTYQPYTPYETPAPDPDPLIGDAEVVLGYHARFPMEAAPRLKWLHLAADGVDHLRGAPIMASARDVVITNTRVFGTPIAEYVFASALAFYRDFARIRQRFQTERVYPTNQWAEYCGGELSGKTLAILGYGDIGHALAPRARAFEMDVVAVRRSVEQVECQDGVRVYPRAALREVLARGDIVVVCLPLTDETQGLIGPAEFQAMKRSAYLVAVGRGGVIDESALVQALRQGWIAGAGLDVYASKPVPRDSPLFDLPNVIMTPHMAGITRAFPPRLADLFCENLRRYLGREPLLNVVDKRKGY
jgi:phosphoglycerate dehydrogenase-like enzyme